MTLRGGRGVPGLAQAFPGLGDSSLGRQQGGWCPRSAPDERRPISCRFDFDHQVGLKPHKHVTEPTAGDQPGWRHTSTVLGERAESSMTDSWLEHMTVRLVCL